MTTGGIIWFTGLSGAGKTTLATALESTLKNIGYQVCLLDGDKLRETICKGLGFSQTDRNENIARIGFIATLLAQYNVWAIVAAISPYSEARTKIRQATKAIDLQFIEVYVKCPLDVLESRDTKGLYKKARAGEIINFTGISDPYEEPDNPELIINTDKTSVIDGVTQIISCMRYK